MVPGDYVNPSEKLMYMYNLTFRADEKMRWLLNGEHIFCGKGYLIKTLILLPEICPVFGPELHAWGPVNQVPPLGNAPGWNMKILMRVYVKNMYSYTGYYVDGVI